MNKRILGLDVCKSHVVAWEVSEIPRNPKQYWKTEVKNRDKNPLKDPLSFYYNKGGIKQLLKLKPDAVALEPTGMHYSALIAEICTQEGIKVLWVGHVQASNYRKQMKLPDKNDLADAFALGCYGLLYFDQPSYFIEFQPYPITRIREIYLQLKSLSRFQTPLINRLRQQLAYEFPEAMDKEFKVLRDGRRALIAWLAQRDRPLVRANVYWDNRYSRSVVHDYKIEISEFTRDLACHIDDYDKWIAQIEIELKELVYHPIFKDYNRTFDEFNFGLMARSVLLSQIYPIEKFEHIGAFKRHIGAAKMEDSSGDSKAWRTGNGSKLCRCELYMWCVTKIAAGNRSKKIHPHSEVGEKVVTFYNDWMKKYSSNQDYWLAELERKEKKKVLASFTSILEKQLKGNLSQEEITRLKTVLATLEREFLLKQEENKPQVNRRVGSKKFGKLVVGKTIGYTCRWLFRRLKANIN